jgi:hypothetical protein
MVFVRQEETPQEMITMASSAHSAANNTDRNLRMTRELWLEQAIEIYWRAKFAEVGFPLPERHHVSVGFGHGAKRESKYINAQCWSRIASKDGINHIFISPQVGDTAEVLALLGHELAHAALDSDEGIQDGHTGRFAEIMTRLGFEGPMTSTAASDMLAMELFTVAAALGDYPHGALDVDAARIPVQTPETVPAGGGAKIRTGPPTQTNRHVLLKCTESECPCKGYAVRTSQRWIAVGLPSCPMGHQMQIV